jgi:O-antigen ligase
VGGAALVKAVRLPVPGQWTQAAAPAPAPSPAGLPRPRRAPGHGVVMSGFSLLLVMMVLGPYLSFGVQPFTGEGNPLRQSAYVLALLLVLAGLQPWRRPAALAAVPLPVLVVLAWCCLSLGWSIMPPIGVRRLLLTVIVMLIVLFAVRDLGARASLAAVRIVLALTLAANWLTVLAFPSVGIHQWDPAGDSGIVGSWCGMMLHKNYAGAACAMTILVYTFAYDGPRGRSWTRWAVIVPAAAFLWGTQSKTSAGIGLLALLCGWLYRGYNPRYRALMIPLAAVLLGTLVLAMNVFWDDIVAPLYNPQAFTGRTQIWPALLAYIRDHPMGAGFGSFWNIGVGLSPMFHYSRGWTAELGSGHNGFLDLAVSIGLPGLALAVLCLFVWPVARLLASTTAPRAEGALALSLIVFAFGHNFTETTLLERDATVQIMLMLGIALVGLITRPRLLLAGPAAAR